MQAARHRSVMVMAGCLCVCALMFGLVATHHAVALLWWEVPLLGVGYGLRFAPSNHGGSKRPTATQRDEECPHIRGAIKRSLGEKVRRPNTRPAAIQTRPPE